MFRIITVIIIFVTSIVAGSVSENIPRTGEISFKDAFWDRSGNLLHSKQKIADLTAQNKAVVLYFFEACFS
ncbi:MAG: hypothetical protein WC212_06585 [Candidatus Delongbacteria bacterium]|jgi:hypothetical protein|nr:hypothetical protein [Candidatus Delongbacteria bacterium]